jgi:signal recognition particle subunit SRP54
LVEKAAATIDAEKAARVAERMRKGAFDLTDLRDQLMQMQQMGGMSGMMGMLPGVAKMKNQLAAANLDERVLKRQMAIIDSMTPKERRLPDLLKASRKKRIAAGSGTKVEDVNRMLKMHRTMADVMKAMSGGGKRGPMAGLANMLGFELFDLLCNLVQEWGQGVRFVVANLTDCLVELGHEVTLFASAEFRYLN